MKDLSDEEIYRLFRKIGKEKIPVGVYYTGDSIAPNYGSEDFDFLLASTIYGFIPGVYFSKDVEGGELNLDLYASAKDGTLYTKYNCNTSSEFFGYSYAFRQFIAFLFGRVLGEVMSYCIPRHVALYTALKKPCYGNCEIINECYRNAGAYFVLGLLSGFNDGFNMLHSEYGGDITKLFPEHVGAMTGFVAGILEAGHRYVDLIANPELRNPLMARHLLELVGEQEGDDE